MKCNNCWKEDLEYWVVVTKAAWLHIPEQTARWCLPCVVVSGTEEEGEK